MKKFLVRFYSDDGKGVMWIAHFTSNDFLPPAVGDLIDMSKLEECEGFSRAVLSIQHSLTGSAIPGVSGLLNLDQHEFRILLDQRVPSRLPKM